MSRKTSASLEGMETVLDFEVAALVPEQYAAWRPLVAGGLRFFLGNLARPRLAALVEEQMSLAFTAPAAERVVALLRHSPTLHKLGQVVARDRRLDPELRLHLQGLESLPATLPMAGIRRMIQREWGRIEGLTLAPAALAEGSVAVVVPFAWEGGDGVFKLLKPGIEERLAEDLAIWADLGGYLEARSAELGLPALDYRETLESVGRLLQNEVRLEGEQVHMAAARGSCPPGVLVPALLPWCTPRMTAMERVHGVSVTAVEGLTPADRQRLAATIVEALLAQPFLNPAEAAPFHADPHAGNLFLSDDGRLAILDWALVAELSRSQREALMRIVLGALSQNGAAICRAVTSLARGQPDEGALRQAVDAALAEIRHGCFPGLAWGTDLLDRLAGCGAVRFPEELLLLRKALLTLQGVLADVDGSDFADWVLVRSAFARFLGELPTRAVSPMDSRTFGCPLSTADLLALALDAPAAALRYWSGQWQDWAGLWRTAIPQT